MDEVTSSSIVLAAALYAFKTAVEILREVLVLVAQRSHGKANGSNGHPASKPEELNTRLTVLEYRLLLAETQLEILRKHRHAANNAFTALGAKVGIEDWPDGL